MSVVLDTHAWLWWIDGAPQLSRAARQAIESAERVRISSISCWELATLARLGRIQFDRDVDLWIRQALRSDRFELMPVSADIAVEAGLLDATFPGDPADRMIYATARLRDARLVTRDRLLRSYDRERTIW